ncbi:helix-turn-helix transcriptional regulator [Haloimpatiens lingqiaonensis]|uniref:helix-turn-helix transcriptional regulator n=1 Tax=Haloimpatiens lingqiaonensis TaxID=1380675 RepID=UPI001485352D|nr:WYL domain-containing protein [Haloimpatiens lingqiaonensis]
MLPYSEYSKSRKLLEMFRLIKSGEITTKEELSNIFEVSPKTIGNYKRELEEEWDAEIIYDKSEAKYVIEREGILGLLKATQPITADDVNLILATLIESQNFMETKMNIIKKGLLGLLPEEEAEKLGKMLHSEKPSNCNDQPIVFNLNKIRRAIAYENKIEFTYRSAAGNHRNHKIIPYSFACEFGKYYIIGKPEDKEKLVHFRLDRIGKVTILDEIGVRSDEFNVYDYLKKTWYMYGGEETKIKVKFNKEFYNVVTEKNMIEGRLIEETDEYFIYQFVANGTLGIKLWILGFGAGAEVLEPYELREEFENIAKEMMKIYCS